MKTQTGPSERRSGLKGNTAAGNQSAYRQTSSKPQEYQLSAKEIKQIRREFSRHNINFPELSKEQLNEIGQKLELYRNLYSSQLSPEVTVRPSFSLSPSSLRLGLMILFFASLVKGVDTSNDFIPNYDQIDSDKVASEMFKSLSTQVKTSGAKFEKIVEQNTNLVFKELSTKQSNPNPTESNPITIANVGDATFQVFNKFFDGQQNNVILRKIENGVITDTTAHITTSSNQVYRSSTILADAQGNQYLAIGINSNQLDGGEIGGTGVAASAVFFKLPGLERVSVKDRNGNVIEGRDPILNYDFDAQITEGNQIDPTFSIPGAEFEPGQITTSFTDQDGTHYSQNFAIVNDGAEIFVQPVNELQRSTPSPSKTTSISATKSPTRTRTQTPSTSKTATQTRSASPTPSTSPGIELSDNQYLIRQEDGGIRVREFADGSENPNTEFFIANATLSNPASGAAKLINCRTGDAVVIGYNPANRNNSEVIGLEAPGLNTMFFKVGNDTLNKLLLSGSANPRIVEYANCQYEIQLENDPEHPIRISMLENENGTTLMTEVDGFSPSPTKTGTPSPSNKPTQTTTPSPTETSSISPSPQESEVAGEGTEKSGGNGDNEIAKIVGGVVAGSVVLCALFAACCAAKSKPSPQPRTSGATRRMTKGNSSRVPV